MKNEWNWMLDKLFRQKDECLEGFAEIDEQINLSELQKKLSKDKANLKGIGEEE